MKNMKKENDVFSLSSHVLILCSPAFVIMASAVASHSCTVGSLLEMTDDDYGYTNDTKSFVRCKINNI